MGGEVTRGAVAHYLLEEGGASRVAEVTVPGNALGGVVVGRGPRDHDRRTLAAAVPALHGASLATLTIDLPAGTRAAEAWVRLAAETLRVDMGGGLPVGYLGAGVGAGAGWAASLSGGLDGVMAWNGRPGGAWSRLRHVRVPSLLVVDHDAGDFTRRLLVAKVLSWQLDSAEIELSGAALDVGLFVGWYWDKILAPAPLLTPARIKPSRVRKHAATIGTAAALVAPSLGVAAIPARSAAALPDFTHASKLSAGQIHGDNWRAGHRLAHKWRHHETRHARRLRAADIFGDNAFVSPFAVGSHRLVDGSGVKYFLNDDITFSTSSSASGAMQEASYTHAVAATTLNGGTVAATLNDAYDGYEALCVVNDNAVNGACATGNSKYTIYNKNGPATPDPSCVEGGISRQYDFNPQAINGLTVSRKVYVPSNDSFARWLDIVTNPGSTPATVSLETSNNLGSDANTVITNDSSGNTTPTTSDTWVTTFQNYIGTTSSDPRLGHVLGGSGAATGLAGISFHNGSDKPFWGYTFTLAPGQTKIIMNFGVVQPSKAAAAIKSAQLAGLSDANELNCMSSTEQSQVVNFSIPPATPPPMTPPPTTPPPTTTPPTTTAPRFTGVSQSHRRWREGKKLPHIASVRPPVGTTFRFTLNESARVRFAFKQRLPGRRVGGRCVTPTAKNRSKPKCTRLVGRGSLSFSVGAGAHRLRFQGRLSRHKRLPIGRYTVVITAINSAGQRATAKLTFTIVA